MMSGWTEVVAEKPEIRFPPTCPSCLSQHVEAPVSISCRKGDLAFSVLHCSRCARNIVRWQHYRALLVVSSLVVLGILGKLSRDETTGVSLVIASLIVAIGFLFGTHKTVRVSPLGEGSFLFKFRSTEYARQFLDINLKAFEPESRWRWKLAMRTWLRPAITFGAVYSLYLGLVMPFAHRSHQGLVPWLGLLVAFGVTYLLHEFVGIRR
jgi:hypothetical protein